MKSLILLFAVMSVFTIACNDNNDNTPTPNPNLAQVIAQSPNLSTLNAALIKANLTGALTTGDNLTVFAPDNAAFATAGITDVNAVPVATLDSILKYHVLGQRVASSAVPVSDTVKTLNGRNIFASRNANGVFLNGVSVKQADLGTSNGVIHVINNVLIPPTKSIAQIAVADTNFTFLVAALTRLNLVSVVSGPGKFTVFAPTNAAFRAVGITDVAAVPLATLETVVKYHVLPTNVFASDFINAGTLTTIQGGTLTVTAPASVRITGSAQPLSVVTTANIVATNGVVHVINRVILP